MSTDKAEEVLRQYARPGQPADHWQYTCNSAVWCRQPGLPEATDRVNVMTLADLHDKAQAVIRVRREHEAAGLASPTAAAPPPPDPLLPSWMQGSSGGGGNGDIGMPPPGGSRKRRPPTSGAHGVAITAPSAAAAAPPVYATPKKRKTDGESVAGSLASRAPCGAGDASSSSRTGFSVVGGSASQPERESRRTSVASSAAKVDGVLPENGEGVPQFDSIGLLTGTVNGHCITSAARTMKAAAPEGQGYAGRDWQGSDSIVHVSGENRHRVPGGT